MTYGYVLFLLAFLLALFFGFDFLRFYLANRKALPGKGEGYKVDAGGLLHTKGGRTYYTLPNGVCRKIADYEFDLNPGSPDMNVFLGIMDKAKRESQADASNKRKAALENMRDLAKKEAGID